jgi:hypothetical protein
MVVYVDPKKFAREGRQTARLFSGLFSAVARILKPRKVRAGGLEKRVSGGDRHTLPEFIPGTSTKLLSFSNKPTALFEKPRKDLNESDRYLLGELHRIYGSTSFVRGNLDAGRLNRLLGREIVYTFSPEPTSLRALLRLSDDYLGALAKP